MARCQYNFNSGILASGKTRMAPKPSKSTTAWWLASNLTNVPMAMKCQVNNQLKPDLPQHKPGSPWENWSLYLQLRSFTFVATAWSLLRWLSQSCDSYAAAFCCRDVGPNGPNNKHGLKEHLWHVASTTSTLASSRVARLGWLPSQAKLPLHDGWHRTPKLCHCS